jgi:hypothetical protein
MCYLIFNLTGTDRSNPNLLVFSRKGVPAYLPPEQVRVHDFVILELGKLDIVIS